MKILFLTNKPPFPLVDGGCIASYNLIESFSDAGHSVTVLSFSTPKHPGCNSLLSNEACAKAKFHFIDIDTNLSAIFALSNFLFSKEPYNAVRFIDENYTLKLVDLLHHMSYDIVQLEGLYMCPYIDTIRKHSSARIVYRSHNIESEIWKRSFQNQSNIIKKGYLKSLSKRLTNFEKKYVDKYDILVPITQRDALEYNKIGNSKPIVVAPAGYNMSKWVSFEGKDNYPHLFHLGALDWLPNQDGILWFLKNVWQRIHHKFPHLLFFIAGRNASLKFEQKVKQFNGVVFVGEVLDATEYINSQGVMIVPLLSGGGMRVKIIEGLALGKTIVTTSIGAEGISAISGKNIVIADSKEKFFAELCTLIEDESLCRRIGREARSFIDSNYNNKIIAGQLLQFYEDTI